MYMHLCDMEIYGMEELFNLGENVVNERMTRI